MSLPSKVFMFMPITNWNNSGVTWAQQNPVFPDLWLPAPYFVPLCPVSSRVDGLPKGSCFGELLPSGLGDLAHLRVFERCAQLYLQFVGVRGGVKMGPSAFRTFTRYNTNFIQQVHCLTVETFLFDLLQAMWCMQCPVHKC